MRGYVIYRGPLIIIRSFIYKFTFTTAIVVWKFFCFWRNISWILYWSWIARRNGSLGSRLTSTLDTIGRSKANMRGVNSLTRARALSTPSISPASLKNNKNPRLQKWISSLTASNGNLIALFVWITPVWVWKMNMTACLRHHSPDSVASLPNDVGMVGVRDIHFHRHTSWLCI